MKKSIILFGGLLFLTTQSCDVLDKEPLDSISTQQYFANANAQALEQYCNDLYPKLITGHGNPNEYNFGMMETDFQSDDLLPWDANSVAFSQHSILQQTMTIGNGKIFVLVMLLCKITNYPRKPRP